MPVITPDTPDDKLLVASELIKARERAGLTQAQLAAQSDVSLSAIKGYETGRNFPGGRELRQICLVLKVSPNRILFGLESPFPAGADSVSAESERGYVVYAERIGLLMYMLTAEERKAVFTLVQSIAAGRHGESEAQALTETADIVAGLQLVKEGEPLDKHLFRQWLRDPQKAREIAAAMRKAADEAEAARPQSVG